jgi:hypothetical protein
MDVYVIPIGHERYELYFEGPDSDDAADVDEPGTFSRAFAWVGR